MSIQIDPRAVVSPKAQLGKGVTVSPFAVVEDDVTIGDGTWIGPHAVLFNGARVGRDCKIFPGASVGAPPQDLKYKGEATTLEVGDRTVIREYVTLNRGTIDKGKTVIGNDCLFMAYTHAAHDCVVGNHVILANCVALAGHVTVEDYAIVGGLTPVHQFVTIGAHAMIGGGFRATKDVPPYVLAGQEPLCFEKLNSIGLQRRGFSEKTISLLEQAFRLIYRSQLNVSQAAERIKSEVELVPEVQRVLDFIGNSKRGIIPGPKRNR
ncbi:MAG: acyl-ACP--UDP-N-acetylglucosamine O-acyltransferase [Ignavibacteriae bacterium]|nr:acyl-ACP--UDP-N-acetylglucosamine O-acyltransferase [Ignavibacteriota bacterium]